jgi:hypothetical protein
MAVLTIEVSSLVFAWLRFCSFLDRPCLPFLFFLFAFLDSMLEGLESGDDSRLRLELVHGLLFSAISLNVAKRMGEKKVFSLSIPLLMLGFTLVNSIGTVKILLLTTKVIQQLPVIR